MLLDEGTDIQAQDICGRTALHHAVDMGCISITKLLLKRGSHFNLGDNDGNTSLHYAVRLPATPCSCLLLQSGSSLEFKNRKRQSPLHLAFDNLQATCMILANSLSINWSDGGGRTPLWYAAEDGHYEIVEQLVQAGATVYGTGSIGGTALERARAKIKYMNQGTAERDSYVRIIKALHKAGNDEIVPYRSTLEG
ncbi:hypothetical protein MMC21_004280 [Puttea exsequens]|nr:hypothetical protein [Puttea exsequens]